MDHNAFADRLERAEAQRGERERTRRSLISRVGREVVPKMESLERVLRTYNETNQAVRRILGEVRANLTELMQAEGSSVGIVVLPDHVFINGVRIKLDTGTHEVCARFGKRLAGLAVAGFTVTADFDEQTLIVFFALLRDTKDIADVEQARAHITNGLLAASVSEISLILREDVIKDPSSHGQIRTRALNAYVRGMAALGTVAAGEQSVGRRRRQRAAMRKLVAMGEDNIEAVMALSGVHDVGAAMENHAMNVALLSIGIGLRIGLPRRDLIRLGLTALNHDVGEKSLPAGLLEMERQLTSDERSQMEGHPLAGMRDLLLNHGMAQPILERALVSAEHHEWFDGKGGYPVLLRPSLHLFSRIVAICDNFDALTMDRPWRKAFTPPEAIKLVIRGATSRFDPVVVRLLVSVVGRYPPGSLVELDTGEWAVVLGPGDGEMPTTRPRVLVVRDPLGRPIDPPLESDTHQRHARRRAYLRTVVRAHSPRDHGINTAAVLCGERRAESIVQTFQG